jgi:phosphoglycolate phosphatase
MKPLTHPRPKAHAVLFDLDGTLLDTVTDLWAACSAMLDELGQAPRTLTEVHSFVGKGFVDLIWRCLGQTHPKDSAFMAQAEAVFKAHYTRLNGTHTTLYPGVSSTLAHLHAHGLALACVTNKSAAFSEPLLERMGLLPFFQCVVSGDTLASRKPEPEMLVHACARLGATPEAAVMVGDSQNDALAAQQAGMPVVLVRYGYSEGLPVDQIPCDARLSAMPDLLDYLNLPPARTFSDA